MLNNNSNNNNIKNWNIFDSKLTNFDLKFIVDSNKSLYENKILNKIIKKNLI